jgi:hypothetical protein
VAGYEQVYRDCLRAEAAVAPHVSDGAPPDLPDGGGLPRQQAAQ